MAGEPATLQRLGRVHSLGILAFGALMKGIATLSRRKSLMGKTEQSAGSLDLRRFESLLKAQEDQTKHWRDECIDLRKTAVSADLRIEELREDLRKCEERLAKETQQRIWLEEMMRRSGDITRQWPGQKPEP